MSDRSSPAQAHSDRGLKRLLTFPQVYSLFGRVIGRPDTPHRLVRDHVQPTNRSRILDLGCGPGSLVPYLPAEVEEYCGVDINAAYIATARQRFSHRADMRFVCGNATTTEIPREHFDLAIGVGLLHHLDDAEAERLFDLAHASLRPGGRFVTWDCAFLEGQPRLARWLIAMDRGRAVRTAEGYERLACSRFASVESRFVHDTLRVPYTICAMTCTKGTSVSE